MQQRRVNYDHVDRILDDMQQQERFKRLKYMLSSFSRIYFMNCSIHPTNEATLVHDTINMMIDAYFKNSPIIKCLGADNMSPSLVNHGKRPDFNVVSNRICPEIAMICPAICAMKKRAPLLIKPPVSSTVLFPVMKICPITLCHSIPLIRITDKSSKPKLS
ncbi:unnamed protein product [Rhizopus stolonifer]